MAIPYQFGHLDVQFAGEPGFFQNILGSPECSVCEPGSISSIFGAHGCELCSLGEYVNSSGKTACTRTLDWK